jgi:xanthine dehydrogenase YagS FAD-binding subunit
VRLLHAGQICSSVAVLEEIKANIPSHVTGDLTAAAVTPAEIRERMSGNICRCGAYSNIVDAITEVAGIKSMRAFTYERATIASRPRPKRLRPIRRQIHRRRHQPARSDEARDRDADSSDRRQRSRPRQDRATPEGGLRIGALVRNTDLAADERVRRDYGVLSRALGAGASGQLRNKATTAGNLLQRTRCPYFYDTNQPCNKRQPGSGCSAIGGFSRQHAVVGTSEACIATHPSDMAIAMRALDAVVETVKADGRRARFRSPSFIACPATRRISRPCSNAASSSRGRCCRRPIGGKHIYRKVRDRASYAFALVSVGAVIQPDGTGRVAVGGVAHKPWRIEAADAELPKGARAAAAVLLAGAKPTEQNRIQGPIWSSARSAPSSPKRGVEPCSSTRQQRPTRSTSSRSSASRSTGSTASSRPPARDVRL